MKVIFFSILTSLLYGQQDSLVKYFSTNIMRTNILKGRPEKKINKNEAHFRAEYYSSGELKSIEFIPANWDKGKRKKPSSSNQLKLYYLKWNPNPSQIPYCINTYKVQDSLQGQITQVYTHIYII